MSRRTVIVFQATILLLFGAVLVWFYTQGRIDSYLTGRGTFQAQVLLAGVVLAVVALFLIITSGQEDASCDHDHGDDDHDHDHANCGHDHDHGADSACDHDHDHDDPDGGHHHHDETPSGMLVTGLVILVPLLAAAIYTPDAYSASWVEKNSAGWSKGVVGETPETFDLRKTEDKPPKPAGSADGANGDKAQENAAGWGPYTLEDFQAQVDRNEATGDYLLDVISIFYTGGDEEVQAVVEGLSLETVGQVMPETLRDPDGHRVRVFRLMMNCCIADARPVSIPVDFGGAVPKYKEMGWYKFRGKLAYEQWDDFTIPVLRAESMEPTESPEQGALGR